MAWEDVESAARFEARRSQWSSPDVEPPRFLERLVRKAFHMPTHRSVADGVESRLVMVVPTAGGREPSGQEKTYGWAVRLRDGGTLEYLRWQAFGKPDWQARFPFEEHQLEPMTPGADHWGPLDAGQRLKTDLDWSPASATQVTRPDGTTRWSISPTRRPGVPGQTGTGMLRALGALRQERESLALAQGQTPAVTR